jgi:hypothetical protein
MPAYEREDPQFWDQMRTAWWAHAKRPLDLYVKYARWFRGDMVEIDDEVSRRLPKGARKTVVNLTNLVTLQQRAELFFRNPRMMVRPPGTLSDKIFTPDLAEVETLLLNDQLEQVGFYRHGRRAILDGLLGPFFVVKVGYTADVAIDTTLVDAERLAAQAENQAYATAATRIRVKAGDLHSVHIEEHEQLLAAAERGELQWDKKTKAYLAKHIDAHKDLLDYERPKETIRNDAVFVRRRSPLNVFFDPWAEVPEDREWCGERYICRIEDLRNNNEFDKSALKDVRTLDSKFMPDGDLPVPPQQSIDTPDKYTMVYEVVDLVGGKVIIYAEGGKKPLLVKDYSLQRILPSGPYIDGSFMEDVLEDCGVPPPAVYEAHQLAVSYLSSVNLLAAKRSVPKLAYDSSRIDAATLNEMRKATIAGLIPFKNLGPNQKIADMIQAIPPAAIPEQNLTLEGLHKRYVEQMSGMGSAKLAGGDASKTATASAIIGESTTTLSEDRAAVLDDWCARIGKAVIRLCRRFYTTARVAEIVGPQALDVWPQWSTRDIVNDRGVLVVPGSSRRRNSAVELKLLLDLYTAVQPDPDAPVTLRMELLRRIAEEMGVHALDFDGMQEQALLRKAVEMVQAQMAAQGAGGPQGGPGGEEGSGGPPGAGGQQSESEEPSHASQQQGLANVGGGRMMTGASAGDKPRLMRGGKRR